MSVLDEHNRQHTYGDNMGPPTSVVGVSAQEAINANRRASGEAASATGTHAPLRGGDHLKLAWGALALSAVFVAAAYVVGGFGAVALGLVAFIAAMFGIIFLVAALVRRMTAGAAGGAGSQRRPPGA